MPDVQPINPALTPVAVSAARPSPALSVVIPTFNSESIIEATVDRVVSCLTTGGHSYEVVVVDDGSADGTWDVLRRLTERSPNVVAVRHRRNYRQHVATMSGLRISSGQHVVTMDDDLQHDPQDIAHLLAKAGEGHDLVIARYRRKQHAAYIRFASAIVTRVNRLLFRLPPGYVMTSFKLIEREVVNRMIAHEPADPYLGGLALMCSINPGNALVEHHPSARGRSVYSLRGRARLFLTMLRHARVAAAYSRKMPIKSRPAEDRISEVLRSAGSAGNQFLGDARDRSDLPCGVAGDDGEIRHRVQDDRAGADEGKASNRAVFAADRAGADKGAVLQHDATQHGGLRSDEHEIAEPDIVADVAVAAQTDMRAGDDAGLDDDERADKAARPRSLCRWRCRPPDRLRSSSGRRGCRARDTAGCG